MDRAKQDNLTRISGDRKIYHNIKFTVYDTLQLKMLVIFASIQECFSLFFFVFFFIF